jgi:hypothetical protein
MHAIRDAIAAAIIATGVGIAVPASAAAAANAAPLDPPPPCPTCQADSPVPQNVSPPPSTPPLKAMKCWPYGRVGPGSARGGGGVPVYPPPCPPGTPH